MKTITQHQSSFQCLLTNKLPKSEGKILAYLIKISNFTNIHPDSLYQLSPLQLKLLKLKLKSARPFLAHSKSSQNSYLSALNKLIQFKISLQNKSGQHQPTMVKSPIHSQSANFKIAA